MKMMEKNKVKKIRFIYNIGCFRYKNYFLSNFRYKKKNSFFLVHMTFSLTNILVKKKILLIPNTKY